MSSIFADNAPAYWAAGLSVIPLRPVTKVPFLDGWEKYAAKPIPVDTQNLWLASYPDSNLGVVLGPQSNLCIIDIDTTDPDIQAVLSKLLPPSPWERRGKKGWALAYQYSGFKTFRIKDAAGKMIVECLSAGTQLVLPPSIHPETNLPYEADCDLFDADVLADLLKLPPEIEVIIRKALELHGCRLSLSGHTRVTDYVSSGSRDVKMISMAGFYASGVLRGEVSFLDACELLRCWHAGCVEKVAGDDVDIDKGIVRLSEFLLRDVTGPKCKPLPDRWDAGLSDADRAMFGFDVFSDLNMAWDCDRMKTYLMTEYMVTEPGSIERRELVNFMLNRMVFSNLDPKDELALLSYMAKTSDVGYTESSLKKSLIKMRQDGIEGENQTQIAMALLAQFKAEGDVCFTTGEFWQWRGSHWEIMKTGDLLREVAVSFGHLPAAKRAGDHTGILKIMSGLVQREQLADTSETGVNFANGFLTPEQDLRPHDPVYGATYTLPYRYTPGVEAPRFQKFLENCWGVDPDYHDKVQALREAIAVTVYGMAPSYERAFLLLGPPKSGKSQLLAIVENLVPNDVLSAVGPEQWSDKFLPSMMNGKLVNIAGELSSKKKIDGAMFKTIVSGENLTGQKKNGQPFRFRPRCAQWFASNHSPRTDDTSSGFTRRWLILVYNNRVKAEDTVPDLGRSIAIDEREAIVSWAMPAIQRMIATGYTLPESHEDRVDEMARANNSLRAFLLDSGKIHVGRTAAFSATPIQESQLYNAYFSFAQAAGGVPPVCVSTFRVEMRELGSELGFQTLISKTPAGGRTCSYANITLASSKVVSLRLLD